MTSPAKPERADPLEQAEEGTAPTTPLASRLPDPLALVVAVVAIGVLVAALHHARAGMYVVCGGVGAGAILRLLLTPAQAGLLVVRKRRFDVIVLTSFALAIGILAAVTPFPSGSG